MNGNLLKIYLIVLIGLFGLLHVATSGSNQVEEFLPHIADSHVYEYSYMSNSLLTHGNSWLSVKLTGAFQLQKVNQEIFRLKVTNFHASTNASDGELNTSRLPEMETEEVFFKRSHVNGMISSVCSEHDEDIWIRNLKRSILLSFSKAVTGKNLNVILKYPSVNGLCDTMYYVDEPGAGGEQVPDDHTLLHTEITNCEGRRVQLTGAPFEKVKFNPLVKMASQRRQIDQLNAEQLLQPQQKTSVIKCSTKLNSNELIEEQCSEVSEHTFGGEAKISIEASTDVLLLHKSLVNTQHSIVSLSALHCYSIQLEFPHHSRQNNNKTNSTEFVLQILSNIGQNVTKNKSELISKLLEHLKHYNAEDLIRVKQSISDNPSLITSFNEALVILNTDEAVKYKISEISKDVHSKFAQPMLASLTKPSFEQTSLTMIQHLLALLNVAPKDALTWNILCNRIDAYTHHGSNLLPSAVKERLENSFASFLGGQFEAYQLNGSARNAERVHMAIKYAKYMIKIGSSKILDIIQSRLRIDNANMPKFLRLASLQAQRSISCDYKERTSIFKPVLFNESLDSQFRIIAYLGFIDCPTENVIGDVKKILFKENASPHLKQYIQTHMKNIMESISHENAEYRELLKDLYDYPSISSRDSIHNSRYAEHVIATDNGSDVALILKHDLLWSDKSYFPSTFNFRSEINLFGASLSLLEVDLHLEGAERVIERLFSPMVNKNANMSYFSKISNALKDGLKHTKIYSTTKLFGNEYWRAGSLNSRDDGFILTDLKEKSAFVNGDINIKMFNGLVLAWNLRGTYSVMAKLNMKYTQTVNDDSLVSPFIDSEVDVFLTSSMSFPLINLQVKKLVWDAQIRNKVNTTVNIVFNPSNKIRLELITPDANTTLFAYRSKIGFTTSKTDKDKVQITQPKEICTGQLISRVLGVRFCKINSSNENDEDYTRSLVVHKTDSQSKYVFEISRSSSDGRIFYFEFDTPASKVLRKIHINIQKNSIAHGNFSFVCLGYATQVIYDMRELPKKVYLKILLLNMPLMEIDYSQLVGKSETNIEYIGNMDIMSVWWHQRRGKFNVQYNLSKEVDATGRLDKIRGTFSSQIMMKNNSQLVQRFTGYLERHSSKKAQLQNDTVYYKYSLSNSIFRCHDTEMIGKLEINTDQLVWLFDITHQVLGEESETVDSKYTLSWNQNVRRRRITEGSRYTSYTSVSITPESPAMTRKNVSLNLGFNIAAEYNNRTANVKHTLSVVHADSNHDEYLYIDEVSGAHYFVYDTSNSTVTLNNSNEFQWKKKSVNVHSDFSVVLAQNMFSIVAKVKNNDKYTFLIDLCGVNQDPVRPNFVSNFKLITPFYVNIFFIKKAKAMEIITTFKELQKGHLECEIRFHGDAVEQRIKSNSSQAPNGVPLLIVNSQLKRRFKNWLLTRFFITLKFPKEKYVVHTLHFTKPRQVYLPKSVTLGLDYDMREILLIAKDKINLSFLVFYNETFANSNSYQFHIENELMLRMSNLLCLRTRNMEPAEETEQQFSTITNDDAMPSNIKLISQEKDSLSFFKLTQTYNFNGYKTTAETRIILTRSEFELLTSMHIPAVCKDRNLGFVLQYVKLRPPSLRYIDRVHFRTVNPCAVSSQMLLFNSDVGSMKFSSDFEFYLLTNSKSIKYVANYDINSGLGDKALKASFVFNTPFKGHRHYELSVDGKGQLRYVKADMQVVWGELKSNKEAKLGIVYEPKSVNDLSISFYLLPSGYSRFFEIKFVHKYVPTNVIHTELRLNWGSNSDVVMMIKAAKKENEIASYLKVYLVMETPTTLDLYLEILHEYNGDVAYKSTMNAKIGRDYVNTTAGYQVLRKNSTVVYSRGNLTLLSSQKCVDLINMKWHFDVKGLVMPKELTHQPIVLEIDIDKSRKKILSALLESSYLETTVHNKLKTELKGISNWTQPLNCNGTFTYFKTIQREILAKYNFYASLGTYSLKMESKKTVNTDNSTTTSGIVLAKLPKGKSYWNTFQFKNSPMNSIVIVQGREKKKELYKMNISFERMNRLAVNISSKWKQLKHLESAFQLLVENASSFDIGLDIVHNRKRKFKFNLEMKMLQDFVLKILTKIENKNASLFHYKGSFVIGKNVINVSQENVYLFSNMNHTISNEFYHSRNDKRFNFEFYKNDVRLFNLFFLLNQVYPVNFRIVADNFKPLSRMSLVVSKKDLMLDFMVQGYLNYMKVKVGRNQLIISFRADLLQIIDRSLLLESTDDSKLLEYTVNSTKSLILKKKINIRQQTELLMEVNMMDVEVLNKVVVGRDTDFLSWSSRLSFEDFDFGANFGIYLGMDGKFGVKSELKSLSRFDLIFDARDMSSEAVILFSNASCIVKYIPTALCKLKVINNNKNVIFLKLEHTNMLDVLITDYFAFKAMQNKTMWSISSNYKTSNSTKVIQFTGSNNNREIYGNYRSDDKTVLDESTIFAFSYNTSINHLDLSLRNFSLSYTRRENFYLELHENWTQMSNYFQIKTKDFDEFTMKVLIGFLSDAFILSWKFTPMQTSLMVATAVDENPTACTYQMKNKGRKFNSFLDISCTGLMRTVQSIPFKDIKMITNSTSEYTSCPLKYCKNETYVKLLIATDLTPKLKSKDINMVVKFEPLFESTILLLYQEVDSFKFCGFFISENNSIGSIRERLKDEIYYGGSAVPISIEGVESQIVFILNEKKAFFDLNHNRLVSFIWKEKWRGFELKLNHILEKFILVIYKFQLSHSVNVYFSDIENFSSRKKMMTIKYAKLNEDQSVDLISRWFSISLYINEFSNWYKLLFTSERLFGERRFYLMRSNEGNLIIELPASKLKMIQFMSKPVADGYSQLVLHLKFTNDKVRTYTGAYKYSASEINFHLNNVSTSIYKGNKLVIGSFKKKFHLDYVVYKGVIEIKQTVYLHLDVKSSSLKKENSSEISIFKDILHQTPNYLFELDGNVTDFKSNKTISQISLSTNQGEGFAIQMRSSVKDYILSKIVPQTLVLKHDKRISTMFIVCNGDSIMFESTRKYPTQNQIRMNASSRLKIELKSGNTISSLSIGDFNESLFSFSFIEKNKTLFGMILPSWQFQERLYQIQVEDGIMLKYISNAQKSYFEFESELYPDICQELILCKEKVKNNQQNIFEIKFTGIMKAEISFNLTESESRYIYILLSNNSFDKFLKLSCSSNECIIESTILTDKSYKLIKTVNNKDISKNYVFKIEDICKNIPHIYLIDVHRDEVLFEFHKFYNKTSLCAGVYMKNHGYLTANIDERKLAKINANIYNFGGSLLCSKLEEKEIDCGFEDQEKYITLDFKTSSENDKQFINVKFSGKSFLKLELDIYKNNLKERVLKTLFTFENNQIKIETNLKNNHKIESILFGNKFFMNYTRYGNGNKSVNYFGLNENFARFSIEHNLKFPPIEYNNEKKDLLQAKSIELLLFDSKNVLNGIEIKFQYGHPYFVTLMMNLKDMEYGIYYRKEPFTLAIKYGNKSATEKNNYWLLFLMPTHNELLVHKIDNIHLLGSINSQKLTPLFKIEHKKEVIDEDVVGDFIYLRRNNSIIGSIVMVKAPPNHAKYSSKLILQLYQQMVEVLFKGTERNEKSVLFKIKQDQTIFTIESRLKWNRTFLNTAVIYKMKSFQTPLVNEDFAHVEVLLDFENLFQNSNLVMNYSVKPYEIAFKNRESIIFKTNKSPLSHVSWAKEVPDSSKNATSTEFKMSLADIILTRRKQSRIGSGLGIAYDFEFLGMIFRFEKNSNSTKLTLNNLEHMNVLYLGVFSNNHEMENNTWLLKVDLNRNNFLNNMNFMIHKEGIKMLNNNSLSNKFSFASAQDKSFYYSLNYSLDYLNRSRYLLDLNYNEQSLMRFIFIGHKNMNERTTKFQLKNLMDIEIQVNNKVSTTLLRAKTKPQRRLKWVRSADMDEIGCVYSMDGHVDVKYFRNNQTFLVNMNDSFIDDWKLNTTIDNGVKIKSIWGPDIQRKIVDIVLPFHSADTKKFLMHYKLIENLLELIEFKLKFENKDRDLEIRLIKFQKHDNIFQIDSTVDQLRKSIQVLLRMKGMDQPIVLKYKSDILRSISKLKLLINSYKMSLMTKYGDKDLTKNFTISANSNKSISVVKQSIGDFNRFTIFHINGDKLNFTISGLRKENEEKNVTKLTISCNENKLSFKKSYKQDNVNITAQYKMGRKLLNSVDMVEEIRFNRKVRTFLVRNYANDTFVSIIGQWSTLGYSVSIKGYNISVFSNQSNAYQVKYEILAKHEHLNRSLLWNLHQRDGRMLQYGFGSEIYGRSNVICAYIGWLLLGVTQRKHEKGNRLNIAYSKYSQKIGEVQFSIDLFENKLVYVDATKNATKILLKWNSFTKELLLRFGANDSGYLLWQTRRGSFYKLIIKESDNSTWGVNINQSLVHIFPRSIILLNPIYNLTLLANETQNNTVEVAFSNYVRLTYARHFKQLRLDVSELCNAVYDKNILNYELSADCRVNGSLLMGAYKLIDISKLSKCSTPILSTDFDVVETVTNLIKLRKIGRMVYYFPVKGTRKDILFGYKYGNVIQDDLVSTDLVVYILDCELSFKFKSDSKTNFINVTIWHDKVERFYWGLEFADKSSDQLMFLSSAIRNLINEEEKIYEESKLFFGLRNSMSMLVHAKASSFVMKKEMVEEKLSSQISLVVSIGDHLNRYPDRYVITLLNTLRIGEFIAPMQRNVYKMHLERKIYDICKRVLTVGNKVPGGRNFSNKLIKIYETINRKTQIINSLQNTLNSVYNITTSVKKQFLTFSESMYAKSRLGIRHLNHTIKKKMMLLLEPLKGYIERKINDLNRRMENAVDTTVSMVIISLNSVVDEIMLSLGRVNETLNYDTRVLSGTILGHYNSSDLWKWINTTSEEMETAIGDLIFEPRVLGRIFLQRGLEKLNRFVTSVNIWNRAFVEKVYSVVNPKLFFGSATQQLEWIRSEVSNDTELSKTMQSTLKNIFVKPYMTYMNKTLMPIEDLIVPIKNFKNGIFTQLIIQLPMAFKINNITSLPALNEELVHDLYSFKSGFASPKLTMAANEVIWKNPLGNWFVNLLSYAGSLRQRSWMFPSAHVQFFMQNKITQYFMIQFNGNTIRSNANCRMNNSVYSVLLENVNGQTTGGHNLSSPWRVLINSKYDELLLVLDHRIVYRLNLILGIVYHENYQRIIMPYKDLLGIRFLINADVYSGLTLDIYAFESLGFHMSIDFTERRIDVHLSDWIYGRTSGLLIKETIDSYYVLKRGLVRRITLAECESEASLPQDSQNDNCDSLFSGYFSQMSPCFSLVNRKQYETMCHVNVNSSIKAFSTACDSQGIAMSLTSNMQSAAYRDVILCIDLNQKCSAVFMQSILKLIDRIKSLSKLPMRYVLLGYKSHKYSFIWESTLNTSFQERVFMRTIEELTLALENLNQRSGAPYYDGYDSEQRFLSKVAQLRDPSTLEQIVLLQTCNVCRTTLSYQYLMFNLKHGSTGRHSSHKNSMKIVIMSRLSDRGFMGTDDSIISIVGQRFFTNKHSVGVTRRSLFFSLMNTCITLHTRWGEMWLNLRQNVTKLELDIQAKLILNIL